MPKEACGGVRPFLRGVEASGAARSGACSVLDTATILRRAGHASLEGARGCAGYTIDARTVPEAAVPHDEASLYPVRGSRDAPCIAALRDEVMSSDPRRTMDWDERRG
jgi:hypothetical protein